MCTYSYVLQSLFAFYFHSSVIPVKNKIKMGNHKSFGSGLNNGPLKTNIIFETSLFQQYFLLTLTSLICTARNVQNKMRENAKNLSACEIYVTDVLINVYGAFLFIRWAWSFTIYFIANFKWLISLYTWSCTVYSMTVGSHDASGTFVAPANSRRNLFGWFIQICREHWQHKSFTVHIAYCIASHILIWANCKVALSKNYRTACTWDTNCLYLAIFEP